MSINYARFLTPVSAARKPSPIRVLTALMARSPPSMISLAGGNPNPETFPFQEAEIKLRDGTVLKLDESRMNVALQYGPTQGLSPLVTWLKDMQKTLHDPPTFNREADKGGLDLCVTTGSQDGICKSIEMMVQQGDNVLIDCPTYAGTLAILHPLGCNLLGVETDKLGMIPASLRKILSRWKPEDALKPDCTVPKVMYTIPNGVNPTGACMTLERKQEIYKIAQEYNIIIMEDDPYFFLQFNKPRTPSYLSLDTDGRVLRFDSFSKVMSSGLRLGFASGPTPLLSRVQLHAQCSSMHTPTLSQVLINDLLQRWGMTGFEEHVSSVVEFYRQQKEHLVAAANKWLKGLAEWDEPQAGMFLWIKLLGIPDTKKLIEEKALAKEVLMVPGCNFLMDPSEPCPFVRLSFSLASPEQMDQAMERLASLIQEELAATGKA